MSSERQMKKIDLNTLENAEHKVSVGKLRKTAIALVILLALSGGGYAAYRMVSGEVIASRFVVNKMNCPACVVTVKEATGKIPGVVESDVSLASQNVIVKFHEKQTGPDRILEAIARAGYPVKLDGLFKLSGEGINEKVVAEVNGKPLFLKDVTLPLQVDPKGVKKSGDAEAFFSVVGKEILLQAADSKTVVVQPVEMEAEVQKIFAKGGGTREEFVAWMNSTYGSPEKYYQIVGQRLGIRKLLDENILDGITNPDEKKRKTMEWVGRLFRDSDVKIVDPTFKEKVHAAAGQDDWKTFWPRMVAGETELKRLLMQ